MYKNKLWIFTIPQLMDKRACTFGCMKILGKNTLVKTLVTQKYFVFST